MKSEMAHQHIVDSNEKSSKYGKAETDRYQTNNDKFFNMSSFNNAR